MPAATVGSGQRGRPKERALSLGGCYRDAPPQGQSRLVMQLANVGRSNGEAGEAAMNNLGQGMYPGRRSFSVSAVAPNEEASWARLFMLVGAVDSASPRKRR